MLDTGDRVFFFIICSISFAKSRFQENYGQRIMMRKRFIFQTLKAKMIMWSDYLNKLFIYFSLP